MTTLGSIISHIESRYKISIRGKYNPRTQIEALKFLSDSDLGKKRLDNHIIYIGELDKFEGIKTKGSILLFPKTESESIHETVKSTDIASGSITREDEKKTGVVSAAEAAENYLLSNRYVSLFDINNVIQDILIENHKSKHELLFDSLCSGNGIQGITNIAYNIIGNPITICDTSFSIISRIPIADEHKYIDSVGDRLFIKQPLIEDMREKSVVDTIYNSPMPFIAKNLTHTPYTWVYEGIRIKNSVVAYVCVCTANRDFIPEDLEIIHTFSRMISIEMQKDVTYTSKAGVKYEFFLTELLEGRFERSRDYLSSQLIQLGIKSAPNYNILICSFIDESHSRPNIRFYYDRLLTLLPGAMIVMFHSRLTILLPDNTHIPLKKYLKNRLSEFITMNRMNVAVSYAFDDISESHIYFRQLEELILGGKMIADDDNFIFYHNNFLIHILDKIDVPITKASIHPHIKAMAAYDKANNTEYTLTLTKYISYNRNANEAANALHIHKSTFFYRLSKMSEIFKIHINDSMEMFAYRYSLMAMEYLEQI